MKFAAPSNYLQVEFAFELMVEGEIANVKVGIDGRARPVYRRL